MAHDYETIHLKPADVIELYDQLKHLVENEGCVMEYDSFLNVATRLKDLKQRIHRCPVEHKQYFRCFMDDRDKDSYHRVRKPESDEE